MHVLFYTRFFLYMLALGIPVLHPSIVVPYDRVGWFLWFGLMPAEMFIAYYLSPPKFGLKTWLGSAGALIAAFIILFAPLDSYTLLAIAVGAGAFILTALIFKFGQRAESVFFLEQFFIAYIYYKILSFTRASESVAQESAGFTQLLMFIIICAFLIHGIVLFLAVFPENRNRRRRKELYLFAMGVAPLLLVVAFLLPPDFVSHSSVLNLLDREVKPKPIPLDESADSILDGGNLRPKRPQPGENGEGNEGEDGERGENGERGNRQGRRKGETGDDSALEGVPSEDWESSSGQGGGNDDQRAVMVVASARNPVYAADAYFGSFDPQEGFSHSNDEPLNELAYLRFLDTWQDRIFSTDRRREKVDIYYLSTQPVRVTAYRPFRIEPTVLTRRFHPFIYSYHTVSNMSVATERDWSTIRGLSAEERETLAPYLEIPLDAGTEPVFRAHLDSVLDGKSGYGETIDAILRGYSEYQYEIGFDENTSVAAMRDFIDETKRGDCTEFSNSMAILARMAGIPSRVVTGYLASRGLQSDSHRRGILMLRESIDLLQEFPVDDLYLVTTAHRHSWTQLYMPGYGWVDFEPTTFAIPPPPGMDPNSARVIIPLLRDDAWKEAYAFPWRLILRLFVLAGITSVVLLYLYRYTRTGYLVILSRGTSPRSLRALSTLLLMRLASAGYAVKAPSRTITEYAEEIPELHGFAKAYNRLRYRSEFPPGEKENLWSGIRSETATLAPVWKKRGIKHAIIRLLSLKGLYY